MSKTLICLVILAVFSSTYSFKILSRRNRNKKKHSGDLPHQKTQSLSYDYYMFATEWKGTVCKFKNCKCDHAKEDVFNLHGLWPNAKNGKHPMQCTKSNMDITLLPSDLQQTLNDYWSGLYNSQKSFISHEWTKHGTCWNPAFGTVENMPEEVQSFVSHASTQKESPEDYIKLATTLSSKTYNIFNILKAGGVNPSSKPVVLSNIVDLISKALDVQNFEIHCLRDETGNTFVNEFRVCLSPDYIPMDCPKMRSGSCNPTVFYPEHQKKALSLEIA